MGADLMQEDDKIPEFIVWAKKDKNGAPLKEFKLLKVGLTPIVVDQKKKFLMLLVLTEMK